MFQQLHNSGMGNPRFRYDWLFYSMGPVQVYVFIGVETTQRSGNNDPELDFPLWMMPTCLIDSTGCDRWFPSQSTRMPFLLHGILCIMWPVHWSVQLIHDPSCQREGPRIPQRSAQLRSCHVPRLNLAPPLDRRLLLLVRLEWDQNIGGLPQMVNGVLWNRPDLENFLIGGMT